MSLTLQPDVLATPVGDGLVLLDRRSGRYWQLNATAATILDVLAGGSSVHEAAEELGRRYPVSAERAAADIAALMHDLRGAGLVLR
jgi:PqqD family protein of HPr-rel-A system